LRSVNGNGCLTQIGKVGHPWLGVTDEELGSSTSDAPSTPSQASTMICTTCSAAGKIDPTTLAKKLFASGYQSFKLESIKIHEASNKHTVAKEIFRSIEAPEKQLARQMLTILSKDDIEKLSHLFITCHALAMKNCPFSVFVWLCELDRHKSVILGKTYMNEESAKEFIRHIREVEREKLQDDDRGH